MAGSVSPSSNQYSKLLSFPPALLSGVDDIRNRHGFLIKENNINYFIEKRKGPSLVAGEHLRDLRLERKEADQRDAAADHEPDGHGRNGFCLKL